MDRTIRTVAMALGVCVPVFAGCEKSANNNHTARAADELNARSAGFSAYADRTSEHADPAAGERQAIGGGPRTSSSMSADDASVWVAATRCEREMRCDKIGPAAKYKSYDDCLAALQKDRSNDLSTRACPSGVSQLGLQMCLQAIREEKCTSTLDTITRVNACSVDKFCQQPSPPGSAPGTGAGAVGG